MATVYIKEYGQIGKDLNDLTQQAGLEPAIAEQVMTITGSSTQSAALNSLTKLVRIHTDAVISYKVGINPTASNTSARMAANSTEYISVPHASGFKIAIISNT